jgi:tagatose 6-phosphate kinase
LIRTVTLSTSWDELYVVNGFGFGQIADVAIRSVTPSGKGVNAARTASQLGESVLAYGLVGSSDRADFEQELIAEGIVPELVEIDGSTRYNLSLLVAVNSDPVAHFKSQALSLPANDALEQLVNRVDEQLSAQDTITINGGRPPGAPVDAWWRLAAVAQMRQARLIADVHGDDLRFLLESKRAPIFSCKPNAEEIGDLTPSARGDLEVRCATALRYMATHDVELPVVTLGARGVRFACDGQVWSAVCPADSARMQVGAGDSFVGGLAVACQAPDRGPHDLIRAAVAVATAHVEGAHPQELRARSESLADRVKIQRLGHL